MLKGASLLRRPRRGGEIGSWFRAVTQSARGIFHWDCADRSPVSGSEPAHASAGSVTFEPGARTAWHTHPLSPDAYHRGWRQTLIIVRFRLGPARGRGPIEEVRLGDVVWFPPGLEALARRVASANDSYRHSRNSEWKECRLA